MPHVSMQKLKTQKPPYLSVFQPLSNTEMPIERQRTKINTIGCSNHINKKNGDIADQQPLHHRSAREAGRLAGHVSMHLIS